MKMTVTEKILARAAGVKEAKAGEILTVNLDWVMTNDATTHISIDIYNRKVKNRRIANPGHTIFIIDHNVPSESVKTTHIQNLMRQFARENGIILHDGEGVCHQLLMEKYISPGEVIIAADSHTCSAGALGAFGSGVGSTDFLAAMVTGKTWLLVPETLRFNFTGQFPRGVYARDLILRIIGDIKADGAAYRCMEFGGPAIQNLTLDDRMTLCNLSVEAGAKNGIVAPDERTRAYLKAQRRAYNEALFFTSDEGCSYLKIYDYNLSELEPAVVAPHFVDNYMAIGKIEKEKIVIDEAFIGSCNNGRIEELRVAAIILRNKKIASKVRLLIVPASQEVFIQAAREGLLEIFLDCGATVLNPNCSVCWGACQGVIGDNEVLISTGTRNFKGRAGSSNSFVYLASAATVAASSLAGRIVDPRNND